MLISHLHRTATKHKAQRNWALGAFYLLEAKKYLLIESTTHYPFQIWLRLPIFLQMAGEFHRAIEECEFLLSSLLRIHNQFHVNDGVLWRSRQCHLYRRDIYDKMKLICKRERNHQLELKFTELSFREQIFFDKKEILIEIYTKKASDGDQSACAAVGHDWKFDHVSAISINKICRRCNAKLHQQHV